MEHIAAASRVTQEIKSAVSGIRKIAGDISIIFVTNIRSGDLNDLGPDGVLNSAQYYTEAEADLIIRSFQSAGFHVKSYFSESDFIRAALDGSLENGTAAQRIVFTAAEGGYGAGRRAMIPAFCRMVGLAYCNSGPHGCSVARHKYHASAILRQAGVPTPDTWLYHSSRGWAGLNQPENGRLVIVKPTYESMAIGVGDDSVRTVDDSFQTWIRRKAAQFGQPATVQEFIEGREIGVPLIELSKTYALPTMEFVLDGIEKFGSSPRTFAVENVEERVSTVPFIADSQELATAISKAAVAAFEALDMRAVGRMDMRVDANGRFWIFDTNESPPPLADTCYARSLQSWGFAVPDMLALWVAAALQGR